MMTHTDPITGRLHRVPTPPQKSLSGKEGEPTFPPPPHTLLAHQEASHALIGHLEEKIIRFEEALDRHLRLPWPKEPEPEPVEKEDQSCPKACRIQIDLNIRIQALHQKITELTSRFAG